MFKYTEEELKKLSPEHQHILTEIDGNNLQYKDYVSKYGVPLGTVRSRLHRARAAILAIRKSENVEVVSEASV